ncbi:nuclear transport factor 2 family protein [Pseudocnuella soli]|uniref:nuclear transport factor 2 family protein n=1 Tax=Pseudocnuella soli TaxID=2502779 RepID=UPI001F00AB2F|nr:nuclear transport factor 2 family protein [Pseudocnuella soli]
MNIKLCVQQPGKGLKSSLFGLCLLLMGNQATFAQTGQSGNAAPTLGPAEQEVVQLSKDKWQWMADKKADTLAELFHDKSVFVHMGGSWGKQREVEVIRSGGIHYKNAIVYSANVNIIGNTAILLNDIDLVAVVGGNEVTNPFMVTEVYVKEGGKWKMGSLSFSRLARPVKTK